MMHTTRYTLLIVLVLAASTKMHAQQSEWEPVNRGLKHLLVYTIEVDPIVPLVMYCGTEYGNLYKTTDGGYNWELSRNGIPEGINEARMSALFLDRKHHNLLYAGYSHGSAEDNLFYSTDFGGTWSGFSLPENWGGILTFFKTTGNPERLYCGQGVTSGIFVSSDSGKSWRQTLTGYGVQVIAGHPSTPNVLFCGNADVISLFKSTDGGESWKEANSGIAGDKHTGVRAIAFAPQNSDLMYLGVTGTGHGLYRSYNQGGKWEKVLNVDQISEISIHPANDDLVYISTVKDGVYRTTDGGATWDNYSLGLPDDPIMRVRIAPGYPVRVFAVTLNHGIFRLVDEELPPQ